MFIWLAAIGLALGSFVNAYVYRVYQGEFAPQQNRKKLSIVRGRSQCPSCEHQLVPKDLLPVLSWLALKGRCRYCKNRISAQYPFVEFAGMVSVLISYLLWPLSFGVYGMILFVLWLAVITVCLALTVADFRWMLLPNKMIHPLGFITVLWIIVRSLESGSFTTLIIAIVSGILLGGFFHIIHLVSGGSWIGGGDVKIGYVLGALVGSPFYVFILLFVSSILALCAFMAAGLVLKRKNKLIPYGPFLIIAMVIIVLTHTSIENTVLQLLML